jgi:CelD/BcsL family acetyltransferase involved in cellulose biosynthesis
MNIRVIKPAQLTPQHTAAWLQILHERAQEPAFDSPFFRPEFMQAVAAVRGDVEIALIEDNSQAVGFFPYQRDRGNVGRPVGGYMSDFQAVIHRPEVEITPTQLVRGCGLRAWCFDHLLTSQQAFQPHHWLTATSPYMDLSQGYDAYRAGRANQSSDELTQTARKIRKVQRELGPVRYEACCTDPAVLSTLIEWKMEQHRRMQVINYLEPTWVQGLLARLLELRDDSFRGLLSALYIGDRLAAARFGLRSHGVLHASIMAYDVELSKFSPGSMLLLETAQAATELGIERLDLGKGPEQYKRQFMSGEFHLAEGSVDRRVMTAALRRGWRRTRELVRASPLRGPAQYVVRNARAWLIYR